MGQHVTVLSNGSEGKKKYSLYLQLFCKFEMILKFIKIIIKLKKKTTLSPSTCLSLLLFHKVNFFQAVSGDQGSNPESVIYWVRDVT